MESTPGPKYSTIAPVPPFTVKIPATFRITSVNTNTKINKVIEICILLCVTFGRYGSLMVNAIDSRSSSLGLSPGQRHHVVFLGKTFTLTVPLSTKMFKWVPTNLILGVTMNWTSIPSSGE